MTKRFAFFLLFLVPVFVSGNKSSFDQGHLAVRITGLKSMQGEVKLALANSNETYCAANQCFRKAVVPVETNELVYIFENLPFGEYAVRLYHDENANDKLDFHWFGKPKERYGFSNNVRGLFGPPPFSKAKFAFQSKSQSIEIRVR